MSCLLLSETYNKTFDFGNTKTLCISTEIKNGDGFEQVCDLLGFN
jgi:hypothetical protein